MEGRRKGGREDSELEREGEREGGGCHRSLIPSSGSSEGVEEKNKLLL